MNVLKSRSKLYPLFTMLLGFFAFLIAGSITLVTFYITNGNGLFWIFYLIELNIIVPAISGLLLSLLLGLKKEWLKMTAACVAGYLMIAYFVRMVLNMVFFNIIDVNTLFRIIIGSMFTTVVFTLVFGLIIYGFNKKVMLWFALAGAIIAVPGIWLEATIDPAFASVAIAQTIAGQIPALLNWVILGAGVGLGIGFVAVSPQKLQPYKIPEITDETIATVKHQYHPLFTTLFGLVSYAIGGLIAMFIISFLDVHSDYIGLFVPIVGAIIGWLLLCLMMQWFSKLIQIFILGAVGTTIELFIGYFLNFMLGFMLMGMDGSYVTEMISVIIWFVLLNIFYGNIMIGTALYFGKIIRPFRFWFYTLICGITAIPFGILYCMVFRTQFWGMRLFPLIIIVSLGTCTGLCIGLSSRLPAIMKRFART